MMRTENVPSWKPLRRPPPWRTGWKSFRLTTYTFPQSRKTSHSAAAPA